MKIRLRGTESPWKAKRATPSLTDDGRLKSATDAVLVRVRGSLNGRCGGLEDAAQPGLEAIHVDVDDGRGEQGKQLAENEAANDGDAEGAAKLGANAGTERERQGAEKRGHGGHHDGAESQDARFVDGVDGRQVFFALRLDSKINHLRIKLLPLQLMI